MHCPKCNFDSPAGMLFCGMCGARLARACIACAFLNPPDFRFCGQCGTALEAPAPLAPALPEGQPAPTNGRLDGERRVATIVVADVRGSTQLLEQVGTERWVELMNRTLQLLETEVYDLGGEVGQFRGDGLVAFFGASAVHEDDPERAIMASLQMQRVVQPLADELAAQGLHLSLRIGVDTGEVILTSVGGRQYREDTVMGEAITLATRMEASAEPGTVLVSENTYHLARPYFTWEELGAIPVKGLREPVAAYRPLALVDDAVWKQQEDPSQLTPAFIGRERELEKLAQCVKDLYGGRGGITLITGEKGMGKSFLVAQVWKQLTREAMLRAEARGRDAAHAEHDKMPVSEILWLRGRCRSYDQSWPYSVWRDMLHNWLGSSSQELPEALRDRLREHSQQLWSERYAEYYPFLAAFLVLPVEEGFSEHIKHLDAESLKHQFFHVIYAWVTALAQRGPLVLFLADLHWIDSISLELLQHCLPLCDTLPLLWLVVFRPDRASPAWDFRHYVATEYPHRLMRISIPPLTAEESRAFLEAIIGTQTLPAEVSDLILQKAEGNPYYLRELVNALVAQTVLAWDAETQSWQLTRPLTSLDLPDSLQTLLQARLDRLTPGARYVLQAAAVIGTIFWQYVLQALIPDSAELAEHLTQLQRAQLIHERQRTVELGIEYAFNSSLLRDVVYDSLLNSQRAAYHFQAAEALAPLLEGDEGQSHRYGMVAYHYREAGHFDQALALTLKAATQARRVYANTEALGHYMQAWELLANLETAATDSEQQYALRRQRFYVLDARRETYYLLGQLESGRADARAMLVLAESLAQDPALLIDALLEQPGVGSVQGREELDAGLPLAHQALALARQLADTRREMHALMALVNLYNLRNDPAWQWTGDQALELARQLGDSQAEVSILLRMGGAYGADNLERSMACLETALPIVQGLHDKSAEIKLLMVLGTTLERQGDYYRLLTEIEQQRLQLSREIGDRFAEGGALMDCGQIQGLWLGDYEAGLKFEEEALRIWENITGRLYPLLRMIQIHAALGNYETALRLLEEEARPVSEREVRDLGRAGLGLLTAILYNTLGDEAHLRQALDAAGWVYAMAADSLVSQQYKMASLCEIAAAHLQLAELVVAAEERQMHHSEALNASGAAFDLYQQFGFVQIVECSSEEILYRHSLALECNGQHEAAQDMLRRAHAEMLRKHALIPTDSPFSRTYLENIPLHREIQAAHKALVKPKAPRAKAKT